MSERKTVVVYHAHCVDGFGAAFAAWCALGNSAEYLPVSYSEPMPEIPDGARVYIVDFSWPFDHEAREQLLALAARCELTVLDHHKTAREALEGLDFAHFDMSKSGAVLAWEYFQNVEPAEDAYGVRGPVPQLLLYIQDRDLWKWELPNSREFSAGLSLVKREFDRWLAIIAPESERRRDIIAEGRISLKRDGILVESMCKRAYQTALTDGKRMVPIMAVNAPVLQSECCHRLLEKFPDHQVVAAYFDENTLRRFWSLRSRPGFDCSVIAKVRGGGGHAQAAGFTEGL